MESYSSSFIPGNSWSLMIFILVFLFVLLLLFLASFSPKKIIVSRSRQSIAEDSTKLLLQRLLQPSLQPSNKTPLIIIVMTDNEGYIQDASKNSFPTEKKLIDTLTKENVIPLKEGVDFAYLTTKDSTLVKDVTSKYDEGARIFVGTTNSPELKLLKPFLDSHPDVLWVSTVSSLEIPFINNNVFRMSSQDTTLIPDYDLLIRSVNNGQVVPVIYDHNDIWATGIAKELEKLGYPIQTFNLVNSDLSGTVLFLSNDTKLILDLVRRSPNLGTVILGDIQNGLSFQVPEEVEDINLYSLGQLISPQNALASYKVYASSVSPQVYSLISVLWFVINVREGGTSFDSSSKFLNYPQRFKELYGPKIISYFDEKGFGIGNAALLTRRSKETGQWENVRASAQSRDKLQGYKIEYDEAKGQSVNLKFFGD